MSLGSGSSGNCYYIGHDKQGLLIDAGIGIRTIKKVLKQYDIPLESLYGVLVTHDHADHIKAVGCLGEKHHIPIYATIGTHTGMQRSYALNPKLATSAKYVEKQVPRQIGVFQVEAFEVPHDGTDNVGYKVVVDGKTFVFATDLGVITPTASHYLQQANYLILEANYDEEMLQMGSYPMHLKERIRSTTGHLSNQHTADFLSKHYQKHLKHIWLCHLSKDNNHPELAHKTIYYAMQGQGIAVGQETELTVLKRTTPSELYTFD